MDTSSGMSRLQLDAVLKELLLENSKQRKVLKVNDPKSIFGKAFKTVTNRDSTFQERLYLNGIWKEHLKVTQSRISMAVLTR